MDIILETLDLNTMDGLHRYVYRWAQDDAHVAYVMSGSETKINATADIGAWLADYFYTQLLTLVGRAKPDILYRPAPNRMYQSLCNVIGPRGLSMEKSGNVWEQLCWHAFEQERGSFVLAVIWNTQPEIVYAIIHPLPNSDLLDMSVASDLLLKLRLHRLLLHVKFHFKFHRLLRV